MQMLQMEMICMHMNTHIDLCVHAHIYAYARMCVSMHVYMHVSRSGISSSYLQKSYTRMIWPLKLQKIVDVNKAKVCLMTGKRMLHEGNVFITIIVKHYCCPWCLTVSNEYSDMINKPAENKLFFFI